MSKLRDRINANRNKLDIGLDREAQKGRQRTVNLDGSFNIRKITGDRLDFDLFHWLITSSWRRYWFVVFVFYGTMNVLFALAYFFIGHGTISSIPATDSAASQFMKCFFFSNQTFTTVGYGDMHPIGVMSSWVASLEAFLGLMSFALATDTLYGRFSKPKPKIKFSQNAVIAPFGDISGFQFMIANQHKSNIMDLEVTVNFSWVDKSDSVRRFKALNLELSKIAMFPLSWTINHIIDEDSPLYGMVGKDLKENEVEAFITLRGFDETYSQTVYIRRSYTAAEFIYGAKFQRAFYVGDTGQVVIDLRKLGLYDMVTMPQHTAVEIEKHLETIQESGA